MDSKFLRWLFSIVGFVVAVYWLGLLVLPSSTTKDTDQLPTQSAPAVVEVKVGYDLYGVGTTASLNKRGNFVPYFVELAPAPQMMLNTQALVALGVGPDEILCDSLCDSYAEVSKHPERLLSWFRAVRLYTLIGGEYAEIRLVSEELLESWQCWVKGIVLTDPETLMVWYSFNNEPDRTIEFKIESTGSVFLAQDEEGVDLNLGYFGEDTAISSTIGLTAVVTTTGKVQVYDHEGKFHVELSPCSREVTNVLQDLIPEGNMS